MMKMKTMKVYHFFAVHEDNGVRHTFDGILFDDLDFFSHGALDTLKNKIASAMTPPRSGKDIALQSLTIVQEK